MLEERAIALDTHKGPARPATHESHFVGQEQGVFAIVNFVHAPFCAIHAGVFVSQWQLANHKTHNFWNDFFKQYRAPLLLDARRLMKNPAAHHINVMGSQLNGCPLSLAHLVYLWQHNLMMTTCSCGSPFYLHTIGPVDNQTTSWVLASCDDCQQWRSPTPQEDAKKVPEVLAALNRFQRPLHKPQHLQEYPINEPAFQELVDFMDWAKTTRMRPSPLIDEKAA